MFRATWKWSAGRMTPAGGSCVAAGASTLGGRGLFATESAARGAMLLREVAPAFVAHGGTCGACAVCFSANVSATCDACGARFCSDICAALHTPGECALHASSPIDAVLALRAAASAHATALLTADKGSVRADQLADTAARAAGMARPDAPLSRAARLALTHAFEVVTPDDAARGLAIFPLCGLANHSCAPNAEYSFACHVDGAGPPGPRLELRALRPIGPAEEILVSYVERYQPRAHRRRELWRTHGFVCVCERCAAPPGAPAPAFEAVRCPRCGAGPPRAAGAAAPRCCREWRRWALLATRAGKRAVAHALREFRACDGAADPRLRRAVRILSAVAFGARGSRHAPRCAARLMALLHARHHVRYEAALALCHVAVAAGRAEVARRARRVVRAARAALHPPSLIE